MAMAQPPIGLPYPAMNVRFWISTTTRCTVAQWNSEVVHEPWAKLYLVAKGQAAYAIRRPGGSWRSISLLPGHLYLIPGGCSHRNSCTREFTLQWCHFTVDAELGPRLAALDRVMSWPLADFAANTAEVVSGASGSLNLSAGALVLTLLARLPDPAPDSLSLHRARIGPATGHLDYFFARDHTIAALAKRCDLRPSRFQQVFRRVHGTTPIGYLTHLRLAEAQRLLGVTTMRVSDIGACVGWANPFHFSRIFRAKTGESPSAWRRRHQPA